MFAPVAEYTYLMDFQIAIATSSILRYRKLAAFFVGAAGLMRLLGFVYLRYLGGPFSGFLAFIPTIILLILAIGVYWRIRGAWTLSFLFCALLAYELLSGLISLPWSSVIFGWQLVRSMTFTAADLTMYVLSMVFLFLMEYKRNRLATEASIDELTSPPI